MRGEYRPFETAPTSTRELPPHTRRIRGVDFHHHIKNGTTSACTENTALAQKWECIQWNYLRVRGEYMQGSFATIGQEELPPRARRIHSRASLMVLAIGTTSACAENTLMGFGYGCVHRNYLRVRGEYYIAVYTPTKLAELPPRARRIRAAIRGMYFWIGTTSACAENTAQGPADPPPYRNYLRVRGEYLGGGLHCEQSKELPPRARRIP